MPNEPKPSEGWTWLSNSPKWHYFVGLKSICGRFALWVAPEFEQGKDESPDNCKACVKALAKRKENKK